MTTSEVLLPHRAKGIDLGTAVLVVARDKIVLSPKAAKHHFTLQFGSRSQTIDLHRKTTAEDGSIRYTTLYTITYENAAKLIEETGIPVASALLKVVQPLRPEWVVSAGVRAVVGLIPTDSELPEITKVRRQKLVVDETGYADRVRTLDHFEDLLDLPDGRIFALVRGEDVLGLGFPFTDSVSRHLVWVELEDLTEALKVVDSILRDALRRFGTVHEPLPWD